MMSSIIFKTAQKPQLLNDEQYNIYDGSEAATAQR
jgi:hypothetical protein